MRLYGQISKVEAQADGTVRVEGIASSEAIDDQGEIVRADAMRQAIPDYMRFPALREMHQLSAAGTTLEAVVGDDGCTRIVGHIVDPVAVSKVKNLVYRGFSIGGQVTARDTANRKIITGITLNEISLVDRPANPEAIFDCWKASAIIEGNNDMPDGGLATIGDIIEAKKAAAEPVQIWACGHAEHRHVAKADAVNCLRTATEDAAKAAPGPVEGAGATETDPGTEAAAETESDAPAAPAATETALEMARAAIERGEAVLARAGAAVEPVADSDANAQISTESDDEATKSGGESGDGSKPYGDVEYADDGLQADGKKRYPIDTEEHIRAAWSYINKPKNCAKYDGGGCAKVKAKIVAAWKDKIDNDGPPSAGEKASRAELAKALWDVGQVASIILELNQLKDRLEYEAMMEGDASPQPAKMAGIIGELCAFLNALVAEETAEILDGDEIEGPAFGMENMASPIAMSAIIASLQKTITDPEILEALVSSVIEKGARHGAMDQVHLDNAAYATSKALAMSGTTKAERMDIGDAHKALIDAGATSIAAPASRGAPANAAQDTQHNAETSAPQTSAGKVPASPMPKASDQELLEDAINKVASSLTKAGGQSSVMIELMALVDDMQKAGDKPHHILMQMAHKSVAAFSDGSTCKDDAADPERHSGETMSRVHKAHYHLGMVGGGACTPGGEPNSAGEHEGQGASSSAKAADVISSEPDALAKAQNDLAARTAENAELVKTVNTIVPLLTQLQARVDDIYNTPLPPMAVVRTGTPTTKAADSATISDSAEITDAQLVAALAKKSPEQQTLAMIKASYATPMPLPASVVGHSQAARDRVPNR